MLAEEKLFFARFKRSWPLKGGPLSTLHHNKISIKMLT